MIIDYDVVKDQLNVIKNQQDLIKDQQNLINDIDRNNLVLLLAITALVIVFFLVSAWNH